MSDVQVTVFGYVGSDVEFREGNGGADRAMFRVGSTPRFFDRAQGSWRDSETVWVTVKAWRAMAHNVVSSIHKGEPVVVVGKLRTHVWKDEQTGESRRRDVVEAVSVGHDLSKGTSAFRRHERPVERVESSADDAEIIEQLERDAATTDTPVRHGVQQQPAA
ncbi:MAG: single-stranded DNA-binding protein [Nocardioidaceae bacterium]